MLVTGQSGFKGSWLTAWLLQLGAEVSGISLRTAVQPGPLGEPPAHLHISSRGGDVTRPEDVFAAFEEHRPEVVIHLAAQPLVRRAYDEPRTTFETNVMGTVNVLDAALRSPSTRAVVVVTTDKVYANREWEWGYREIDELGGHDPYSASKAAAELAARAYTTSAVQQLHRPVGSPPVGIASARAGNIIGGGDWAQDRLLPDVMRAIADGRDVVLRNPTAVRPWQHVVEPLSGYLWLGACLALDPGRHSRPYNFGPAPSGPPATVREMAESLLRLWGASGSKIVVETDRLGREAQQLRLDASRAQTDLDWRPLWNLDRTLTEVVRWYRAAYDLTPSRLWELSTTQIRDYTADALNAAVAWAICDRVSR